MRTITTVSESIKLKNYGIDVSTADAYYPVDKDDPSVVSGLPEVGNPDIVLEWINNGNSKDSMLTIDSFCIPAWSLTSLLSMISGKFSIEIETDAEGVIWIHTVLSSMPGKDLVEAAVKTVVALSKKGYYTASRECSETT